MLAQPRLKGTGFIPPHSSPISPRGAGSSGSAGAANASSGAKPGANPFQVQDADLQILLGGGEIWKIQSAEIRRSEQPCRHPVGAGVATCAEMLIP